MPSTSIGSGLEVGIVLMPAVSAILTVHPRILSHVSMISLVVPLIEDTMDRSLLPVKKMKTCE